MMAEGGGLFQEFEREGTGGEEIGRPSEDHVEVDSAQNSWSSNIATGTTRCKSGIYKSTLPRYENSTFCEDLLQGGSTGARPKTQRKENISELGPVQYLLELQSVLGSFEREVVRNDFLSGKIIKLKNPEQVLQLLDGARRVFSPMWECSARKRNNLVAVATQHLDLIQKDSKATFVIVGMDDDFPQFSYSVWRHALDKIMKSNYWVFPISDENGETQEEVFGQSAPIYSLRKGKGQVKLEKRLSQQRKSNYTKQDGSSSSESERRRKTFRKKIQPPVKKFETLEISDSSSTDSAVISSSDSSCDDFVGSRSRSSREVVQPEIFNGDGRESLRQFLETYERYFRHKFDGTQRDCTRELGRFLTGEVREAFDSLGGAQRKYIYMKEALLDWYKTQKVGRTHRYRLELRQMSMKQEETLKLYCVRLLDVGQKAYPNDDRECLKQLRRRLVKTAPKSFVDTIEKREDLK